MHHSIHKDFQCRARGSKVVALRQILSVDLVATSVCRTAVFGSLTDSESITDVSLSSLVSYLPPPPRQHAAGTSNPFGRFRLVRGGDPTVYPATIITLSSVTPVQSFSAQIAQILSSLARAGRGRRGIARCEFGRVLRSPFKTLSRFSPGSRVLSI